MLTKTKKILEWSIFSFLGLVALVGAGLFSYQVAYAGKIYKNVKVANLDLSGKTKVQAEALLVKQTGTILDQEFIVKTSDQEVKVKLADTGLSLDTEKTIEECFSIGRDGTFIVQLGKLVQTFFSSKILSLEPQINQDQYNKFVSIAVAQLNSEPKDAALVVDGGQVSVVPEKDGWEVDTSGLAEQILNLASTSRSGVIEIKTKPKPAAIKSADFSEAKGQAETILAKNISFAFEGKVYSPSRIEIGNWITFPISNGKHFATLSDSNVTAYLTKIAKDFEIQKVDRKINVADNSVIEEGREGKYLDKKDALRKLKSQLGSPAISVELATYVTPPSEVKVFPNEGVVPGRFEGKYIDVDLGAQKLCTIEGQNILGCYTVSSGKPSMPTPKGTRYILNKNPKAWSSKYGLYMPWWQDMGNSYGIHELPEWPNGYKEGESHLGTPVSHGCVRLGVGPAESVYNWTNIGTPVYIH